MAYIGKSPQGSGVRTRYYFTQTSGGATSISGTDDNGKTLSYTDGEYVDVYLNGVLLVHGTDYGTGTANTISSLAALANGDVVEVVVYDVFNVAKINSEAIRNRYYFTATGGETSIGTSQISNLVFPANAEIDVKLNGVTLQAGTDYNTTSANTVGGLSALTAGQVVEIVYYEKFVLGDTVSKASGGTFANDIAVDGNVLAGKTSGGVTTDGWQLSSSVGSHYGIPSGQYFIYNRTTSGAATMVDFRSQNSSKGAITYNGTNISYTSGANNIFNQAGVSFDNGSNYLDDYEEGTFTPDLGSSVGSSSEFGKYTKVGDTVFIQATLNVASNTNGNHMQITNFPFTGSGAQPDRGGFFIRYTDYGDVFWLHFNGSNTTTGVYTKSGGALTYANMSGKRLDFLGFYSVA